MRITKVCDIKECSFFLGCRFLILLATLVAPVLAVCDVVIGITEEREGRYVGEKVALKARALFMQRNDDWVVLDFLGDSEFTRDNKMKWTVAFDGKNLGSITTLGASDREKHDSFNPRDNYLEIQHPEKVPTVRNKYKRFARWSHTPEKRPLVLVSKPYFRDAERWKSYNPEDSVIGEVFKDLKSIKKTAHNCGNPPEYKYSEVTYSLKDLKIYRAYRNLKGERLVAVGMKEQYFQYCEVHESFDEQPHWFYLGKEINHLGKNMDIIDAGDYDNDGEVEFMFSYGAYNRDGYILFESHFSGKHAYVWSYH